MNRYIEIILALFLAGLSFKYGINALGWIFLACCPILYIPKENRKEFISKWLKKK